LSDFFLLVK